VDAIIISMLDLPNPSKDSSWSTRKHLCRTCLPRRRSPSLPTILTTPSLADKLYTLLVSFCIS
jgi:hypothetical protein